MHGRAGRAAVLTGSAMADAAPPGTLGPRPEGDPEAMRRYAGSLRSAGESIGNAGKGAADAVDAATFVGPGGDATRFRAGRLRTRSARRARELAAVAEMISQSAGTLQQAQEEWGNRRELTEQRIRKLAD